MAFSRPYQRWLLTLTAGVAVLYGAWIVMRGIAMSPDSHTYSKWADLLIAHRFNIAEYLNGDQNVIVPPVLYLLWIILLATLKVSLGSSWTTAVVALNWVAAATGAYLILRLIRDLAGSRLAMVWAAASLVVCADILIFLPFVLSDWLFWAVSTAVLVLGVQISMGPADASITRRRLILGSVPAVLALGFRPSAAPVAAFWLVAVWMAWHGSLTRTHTRRLVIAVAAVGTTAVITHAYFMMNPASFPPGPVAPMIARLGSEYQQGILVYVPGGYGYVAPATDLLGALRLTSQRLLYFFNPWLPSYSVAHLALNTLFFGPVYVLALVGAARSTHRLPVIMLVIFIAAISVFHALMQIDYDNRYRLPVLPALLILGGLGVSHLFAEHPIRDAEGEAIRQ